MLLTAMWAYGAMRPKLFYILSACVATAVLLTPSAISSTYGTNTQKKLTKLELLKVERGNIRENDIQKNQNQQNLASMQFSSVVNSPHESQSYQLNFARQLDKNLAFLVILFITYVIASYILLEVWYKIYQNQCDNEEAAVEISLIEREEQIETLERIWRMKA